MAGQLKFAAWTAGSAMKIRIEKAACVGNARCTAMAPGLYPLDDDGYIASEGEEALAQRGARACPERIISIVEGDG